MKNFLKKFYPKSIDLFLLLWYNNNVIKKGWLKMEKSIYEMDWIDICISKDLSLDTKLYLLDFLLTKR